jgi:signal peptidase I
MQAIQWLRRSRAVIRFVADVSYYHHRVPHRGEVILLLRDEPGQGTVDLVKRIIGIGGDTIEASKNGVYLNGKLLNEPYARYNSPDAAYDTKRVFGPITVPPGQYFLMGDNRDDSYDSRYFGTVPLSSIEGRLLYLYWSRDRSRIGQVIR